MDAIDVMGFGAVAVDDLVVVDRYPNEDSKVEARGMLREPGGLSGTALVAAARMGGRCAYVGTLGEDDLSGFILDRLSGEGIDVSAAVIEPQARPFHSIVIVGTTRKTRTIIYSSEGVTGAHPTLPPADVLAECRVVLLDHAGTDGMIRLATAARRLGIPRVGDFERLEPAPFDRLLSLANHLIVPLEFALELTGCSAPEAAIAGLWDPERELVAVTNGEEGSWYRSAETGERIFHQDAVTVGVVDTTGCGDVFHGVYAYALAKGLTPAERMEMASAAAALKATRPGGQSGIPFLGEVVELRKRLHRE